MKRYIERVWELMNDAKMKHYVPLYDEATPKGVSYEQLRVISGRVYAYLKARNIGKEDFVMIKLPRGVQPVIAMIGVWRAGAAFVLVEDTLAPERIDFMYKDCGCKLAITSEVWEELNRFEPLDGYEETDHHDAAFAVYTSGTTGNPKGVLHEYGNLERCIQSFEYEGEHVAFPGVRSYRSLPYTHDTICFWRRKITSNDRRANGVFLHRIFNYANLVRFDCRLYLHFAVAGVYFRASFAYDCDV